MKRSNPLAHICLLLVILIPYGLALLNHNPTVVESVTDKQVLLEKDSLKVTSSYQIDSVKNSIDWSLYYESQAKTDTRQALKVKFTDESMIFEDHSANWKEDNYTSWWQQTEFWESSKGVLQFSTPMDQSIVEIAIQLDVEGNSDDETIVNKNQLSESEAGPYRLVANLSTEESSFAATPKIESSSTAVVPSTNSSSVEKTKEGEGNQTINTVEPFVGPLMARNGQNDNSIVLSTDDLFSYTTNGTGTFPTHNTQQYLGSGSSTEDSIKNYNYGTASQSDSVSQYSVTNGTSAFDNGYHEYGSSQNGRINTKKSVKKIGDNLFEVTVDTIGDAIQPLPKVDVAIVLDKSGSMLELTGSGKTRWGELESALSKFLTGISSSGMDVKFALSGFHSSDISDFYSTMGIWSGNRPTAYSDLQYNDLFTNDAGLLLNTNIIKGGAFRGSATPTFLGLDSGLFSLTKARSDAVKVLCMITDGVPTIYPVDTYYNGTTTFSQSLGKLYYRSPEVIFQTSVDQSYSSQAKLEGSGSHDHTPEYRDYLAKRLAQFLDAMDLTAYKWYAVGFHYGNAPMGIIETVGRNGYYSADNTDALVDALSQSLYPYVSTINNATLTDPMSEYVTMVRDSELLTPITVNDAGELTVKTADANGNVMGVTKELVDSDNDGIVECIKINNMNLGKSGNERSGVRLTYQVSLKDEYRDGKFYPANKTTYLTNGNNGSQTNYFYGVPSVKYGTMVPETVDVPLKKVIKGTDIDLSGAQFGLFAQENDTTPSYRTNISEIDGNLLFRDVIPGNYWLKEITIPNGYKPFTPVQIEITAEGTITGLSSYPKIENELKPFKLNVWKQTGNEKTPLEGAIFELYDKNPEIETTVLPLETITSTGDGQVQFTRGLETGITYYMKEKAAPDGYVRISGLYTIEILEDGEVVIKYNDVDVAEDDIQIFLNPENEDNTIHLNVQNKLANPLPRTGGNGRVISYLVFVLLLTGLVIYYVLNRRDISQKGGV
ncbi:VWA domain-containing protein [Enterococcus asini]|uniref:VWA domain-containing protein n=1 Tax=Enterococcus asini TaxID=57732 RepID=UPI0028928030|nr:VWA domain-containing protein [Enterococcus asini]MDT2757007.1 VWA domain-containing protein [Enterococcus asini]